MNPDEISIEIPLQNEKFLESQPDNTYKPSLRLLKIFVDEQSMMGHPTVGHISPEQYDIFKGMDGVTTKEDEPDVLYTAVTKNPEFKIKVVGRADHPGTDYYEEVREKGEEDGTYVAPVFDPKTGLPQDLPSVIKPAEAETQKEETQDDVPANP